MDWKHLGFLVVASVSVPIGCAMGINLPDEPSPPFAPEQRVIGGTTHVIAATTTTTPAPCS